VTRLLVSFVVLFASWWLIANGDPALAFGGLVFAAAATLMHAELTRGSFRWRVRPAGLVRVLLYFIVHSILASIDVARRAFARPPRLAPAIIEYPLRLTDETARIWFMNTINLLPGTLTVSLEADRLKVHVLDRRQDMHEQLMRMESAVSAVFDQRVGAPTREER
jgi:multicomponent Na+:H+ antiporter subunit E